MVGRKMNEDPPPLNKMNGNTNMLGKKERNEESERKMTIISRRGLH